MLQNRYAAASLLINTWIHDMTYSLVSSDYTYVAVLNMAHHQNSPPKKQPVKIAPELFLIE